MSSNVVFQGSVAIIGGGIIGSTLAVALVRRGVKVTIYEQASQSGEVGAGVAFSSSAVRAMDVCSPKIVAGFRKVRTVNANPDKLNVSFDWYDAMSDREVGCITYLFTNYQQGGIGACHRAHFLDEILKLLPSNVVRYGKRLRTIEDVNGEPVKIKFHDGTETMHDAVIGADGIRSTVRQWMLGDHPSADPVYTHKYAYRGLIPIDRAAEALGDDFARNSKMFLGRDGHMLTFPIARGTVMNVVFFFTDTQDWSDKSRSTRPASRDQIRHDFRDFGATVHQIIDLLEPSISCWGIFDVPNVPCYNRGRVVLAGDAGHASSPHHGGGAGIGIEDCAILAELLADYRLASGEKTTEDVFRAFSDQRLERTHWFVESSRYVGEVFDRRSVLGDDKEKIQRELLERLGKVWNGQISEYIAEAKNLLGKSSRSTL